MVEIGWRIYSLVGFVPYFDVVAGVVEDADEAEVLDLAGVDLRREVGGENRLDLGLPVGSHETARQEQQSVRLTGKTQEPTQRRTVLPIT